MLEDMIIGNKSYAVLNIAEDRKLDEIAIRVLRNSCPEFLLPFKTIFIDGNMEVRYELSDGIRMSYQSQRMYKKEFVQQMISMLLPFKNCSDWMLDYHCILLDPQYIFINGKDQAVRYVYIPVCDCAKTDESIKSFFSKFVIGVELLDDKSFTLKILRLLQDDHSSLMAVLEFLQNEKGTPDTTVNRQVRPPEPPKKDMEEKPPVKPFAPVGRVQEKKEEEKEEKKEAIPAVFGEKSIESALLSNLYGDEQSDKKKGKKKKEEKKKKSADSRQSGKGLFGGLFGGKKSQDQEIIKEEAPKASAENFSSEKVNINAVSYQQPEAYAADDAAPTEMDDAEYNEENDRMIIRLHLEGSVSYPAPSDIELNLEKGYATVGRYDKCGVLCADFNFDYSLTFISRNHFRIELCEGGYKIIDLNSTNGTFLNGQEMQPNIAYDLKAGDTIALSRKTRLTYRVL